MRQYFSFFFVHKNPPQPGGTQTKEQHCRGVSVPNFRRERPFLKVCRLGRETTGTGNIAVRGIKVLGRCTLLPEELFKSSWEGPCEHPNAKDENLRVKENKAGKGE